MKKAFLTLAVLAAGCATPDPDLDVVTTHHRQQTQTRVVAEKRVEAAPPVRLVEKTTVAPAQAAPPARPVVRAVARPAPKTEFFQVGPAIVINTLPTPAATPTASPAQAPVQVQVQPPAQALPPMTYVQPTLPAPVPVATPESGLETAPGFRYQNGGVNGTTAPLTRPTPALPTAEGFEYRR